MREQQETAIGVIQKMGAMDYRQTVNGVLSAARGIDSYILKGKALPLLSRADAAILAKATAIMRGIGTTLEKARVEKQRQEEQERKRLTELEACRRKMLMTALPKPTDPSEFRNVLLWRLAGDAFFNEAISDAFFPDSSMVVRDLKRCQSCKNESLKNHVDSWWLEVHLYLSDNLWPQDQEPHHLALDNLLYQFNGKWLRRVEMMYKDILVMFDQELAISQAGNVLRY